MYMKMSRIVIEIFLMVFGFALVGTIGKECLHGLYKNPVTMACTEKCCPCGPTKKNYVQDCVGSPNGDECASPFSNGTCEADNSQELHSHKKEKDISSRNDTGSNGHTGSNKVTTIVVAIVVTIVVVLILVVVVYYVSKRRMHGGCIKGNDVEAAGPLVGSLSERGELKAEGNSTASLHSTASDEREDGEISPSTSLPSTASEELEDGENLNISNPPISIEEIETADNVPCTCPCQKTSSTCQKTFSRSKKLSDTPHRQVWNSVFKMFRDDQHFRNICLASVSNGSHANGIADMKMLTRKLTTDNPYYSVASFVKLMERFKRMDVIQVFHEHYHHPVENTETAGL